MRNLSRQMSAVIPAFLPENDIWHTAECLDILAGFFDMIGKCSSFAQVCIVTNDSVVRNIAEKAGHQAYLGKCLEQEPQTPCYPFGTKTALGYLRKETGLQSRPVFILNFRNPLITPDIIQGAVDQFYHQKGAGVLSVKKSVDHPCQLYSYHAYIDAGMVCLFDDTENADAILDAALPSGTCQWKLRITKPFYFDWLRRGIAQPTQSRLYYRVFDGFSFNYIPLTPEIELLEKEDLFPMIQFVDYKTARAVFRMDGDARCSYFELHEKRNHMVGCALSAYPDAFLAYDPRRESAHFQKYGLPKQKETVRLEYWVCKGKHATSHLSAEILNENGRAVIPLDLDAKQASGLIYALKSVVGEGRFEECIPFPARKRLWAESSKKGKMVNIKTGKQINGRQDFPEVLEPDASFLITQGRILLEGCGHVFRENRFAGFVLPEENTLQIDSKIDLLKLRAMRQNANH